MQFLFKILMSTTQMTYHFHCSITPPLIRVAVVAPKLNWLRSPGRGDPYKSLQILGNPYKSLQLLLSPYKSLHILGNPYKPLQILTTPYKSLQILTNAQRGEGTEARKSGNVKSTQTSCFLIIFFIKEHLLRS